MADVVQMMTLERRKERLAEGLEFVVSNTTSFWAAEILTDLKAVGRSSDRTILSPVGLGLNFRVVGTFFFVMQYNSGIGRVFLLQKSS